jgi:hypothetical protein
MAFRKFRTLSLEDKRVIAAALSASGKADKLAPVLLRFAHVVSRVRSGAHFGRAIGFDSSCGPQARIPF